MSEEDGLRLTLTSSVRASREQTFRMLTEPAEVAKWWGPHGFAPVEAEVDLRVGGAYRFTMKPPEGSPFHISGRFLSIDLAREIAYTFQYEEPAPDDRETVVELSLEDQGQDTLVSVTQASFATEERLALHRSGWSDSLERLKAVIEG